VAKNDGDDFAKRLGKAADNLIENVEKRVRRAALLADETLVLSTPVDTGRARSNWLVTVGSPASFSSAVIKSPESAIAEARAAVEQFKISRKGILFKRASGNTIFITNNVSYISKLNSGSSAQAPAGFVEAAVSRARRSLGSLKNMLTKGGV
jgi:hypothetical protein